MRARAFADRGVPLLFIDQRDQHRRIVAVEERDLQHAQRVLRQPLALEARHALRVGDQEAGEVAADDRALLLPHRTRAQHAVGGADPAVGVDQCGHDAGAAKPVAGPAGDQIFHRLRKIEPLRREEPPDEQILVLAGASHFGGKLGALEHHAVERRPAIAPRGATGAAEPIDFARFERQARRRRKTAEHGFVAIVGADQTAGAVGHRDRVGAARGERAGDAPIGFWRGAGARREEPSRGDQAAGENERCGKKRRGERDVVEQQQDHQRSGHPAADRDYGGAARSGRGRGRGERGHRLMLWALRRARQDLSGGVPRIAYGSATKPADHSNRVPAPDAGTRGAYQTFTRSAGARYILSPGLTPNAAYQASTLRTSAVRNGPGECGSLSSCERKAGSRNLIRQTCA